MSPEAGGRVALTTIAREWGRIGVIGFGGPPTHISLLRKLCVEDRHWLVDGEFEDGIAAVNLLPGPASTQLAIFCAWRLRGAVGALLGGACFIVPGLVIILALSALFLATDPPRWIEGAAAGAGAAVPAVAIQAALGLLPANWKRAGERRSDQIRWVAYLLIGGAAAATVGPYLVVVLLACGLAEVVARRPGDGTSPAARAFMPMAALPGVTVGGVGALAWVAFKVGALSYGGGFVIIPLMQHDAVACLPLDDQRPVPQRRRPGTGHPRTGRADRGRRRLCRRRDWWGLARGADRLRPVFRVRPGRRATSLIGCGRAPPSRPSSRERAPPPSAPSPDLRSR